MPSQIANVAIAMKTLRKHRSVSPKDRLLEAATQLFCRYGVNSIGVDAIVAKAGTAKATLYNVFGSKEALACAVLDREGMRWREWLFKEIDAFEGDGLSRLLHIFDLLALWFSNRKYYGCPFINAVAESDKLDQRLRSIALDHKKIVLNRIVELIREAQLPEPEKRAHELGLIIDGAIVAALITKDPKIASVARSTAAIILNAHQTIAAPKSAPEPLAALN